MKDIVEELKSIRNMEGKAPPTLSELQQIAERSTKAEEEFELRHFALKRRLLPDYYASFTYNGPPPIESLTEETLFYIFYAFVNTDLQVSAYNELIEKGYVYSRTLDLFVSLPSSRKPDGISRTITVFDPWEWKKTSQAVVFSKDFIQGLEGKVQ